MTGKNRMDDLWSLQSGCAVGISRTCEAFHLGRGPFLRFQQMDKIQNQMNAAVPDFECRLLALQLIVSVHVLASVVSMKHGRDGKSHSASLKAISWRCLPIYTVDKGRYSRQGSNTYRIRPSMSRVSSRVLHCHVCLIWNWSQCLFACLSVCWDQHGGAWVHPPIVPKPLHLALSQFLLLVLRFISLNSLCLLQTAETMILHIYMMLYLRVEVVYHVLHLNKMHACTRTQIHFHACWLPTLSS